ncbi:hypothetical protein EZS27_008360 [termite gut metagenome]|uniref:DUF1460 domain-containing protein n=1 Tax=termite gut metagenome TaxID=433724 RepID=A0A5J4SD99_9ZZZZ
MKMVLALLLGVFLTGFLPINAQKRNPVLENGLSFLGTPYVANTLEEGDEETLIVNSNGVDCITFVEYVLAMSLCPSKEKDMTTAEFRKYLRQIRYRDGKIEGYTSRLHYVSDWINDNIRKEFIEDVTAAYSSFIDTLSLSFMSTHAEYYKQLDRSPENRNKMLEYEKALSGQTIHWIPKKEIPAEGFSWIENGNIIAITTTIPGLDSSHIGIAVYVKEELHLLHASSVKGRVVVEEIPLSGQLNRNKNMSGIRVLRMKKTGVSSSSPPYILK